MIRGILRGSPNRKVYTVPGGEFDQIFLSTSEDPRLAEIGQNRFLVPSTWEEYYQISKELHHKKDVILLNLQIDSDLASPAEFGFWYKAKEAIT